MKAQEWVLDRIEQSIELYKDNFLTLTIPMFFYAFLSTVLTVITTYAFMGFYQKYINLDNITWLWFYEAIYNPQTVGLIIIAIIFLILFLSLYIPFVIWLIKWVSQAYNWEKPNWKENLKYGFKNLFNSFKTYWYIFAYVALIPALLFIIGWVTLLYWMQYNNEIFTNIWWIIVFISLIIFIVFSIYRWVRSTFAIQSAIDKDSYTTKNFKSSISITKNNIWRIIWNFLLVWLFLSLIVGIVQWVINWITNSMWWGLNWIFVSMPENIGEIDEIQQAIKQIIENYSPLSTILVWTLESFVQTISSICILVFTYIFFKRLENESNITESTKAVTWNEL